MKLVEILARELKEWPSKAAAFTQDRDGDIWPCTGLDVDFNGDVWTSAGLYMLHGHTFNHDLASDYKTAIVIRAEWESERARIAKHENKDGWIRHRGGKCPVADGVRVEYRMRDGSTGNSVAGGERLRWTHESYPGDIMAYRLHKPSGQPVIEPAVLANVQAFNELAELRDDSQVVLGPQPIKWRDRITEIDATVEALEEERASLVQLLEAEGFRLIERAVPTAEDMSDCQNWKRGDKIMANDDSACGGFNNGGIYAMREDCTNKDHSIKVVEDDNGVENGWDSKFFNFHSRPSK